MGQQAVMNNSYSASPSYPTMSAIPMMIKTLHFYNFKGVNIKRGDRVYLRF